jgi:hypothetical protein
MNIPNRFFVVTVIVLLCCVVMTTVYASLPPISTPIPGLTPPFFVSQDPNMTFGISPTPSTETPTMTPTRPFVETSVLWSMSMTATYRVSMTPTPSSVPTQYIMSGTNEPIMGTAFVADNFNAYNSNTICVYIRIDLIDCTVPRSLPIIISPIIPTPN